MPPLTPFEITPVEKVVLLAPEIVKTCVDDAAVELTFPVKVIPALSLLLIVLLARTLIVRLDVNALLPIMESVPPPKLIAPEAPKFASDLIAKVPPIMLVPPV